MKHSILAIMMIGAGALVTPAGGMAMAEGLRGGATLQLAQADCVRVGRNGQGNRIYRCQHGNDSYTGTTNGRDGRYYPNRDRDEAPIMGSRDSSGICANAMMSAVVSSNVINICRKLGWAF